MNSSIDSGGLAPIIAHRGASADAPENTLAAIALAADQGVSCIEIDVSISSDGVPYVHHDDTLDRCTTGTGLLCKHSSAQLDQLDASKLMPGFSPEPLPRLSVVIKMLEQRNLGLNLEIKPRKGLEEATVNAICTVLEKSWPEGLPLVFSSFNHAALEFARQQSPTIARALLIGPLSQGWQLLMNEFECCNVHASANALKAEDVKTIKNAGFGLYAYTVNDPTLATTLFGWGVDGVFTDHPGQLLGVLQA